MAELVPLDRSGDWRKRLREAEEVAVGFRAVRPDNDAGPAAWANWRGNRTEPTIKSITDMDLELCLKLEKSGRVDLNELLTYQASHHVLNQGVLIDPHNNNIVSILNDMARGRRMLLDLERKEMSKTAEARKISNKVFAQWPATIQTLQGEVASVKGRNFQARYVRIPPLLVSKIALLN